MSRGSVHPSFAYRPDSSGRCSSRKPPNAEVSAGVAPLAQGKGAERVRTLPRTAGSRARARARRCPVTASTSASRRPSSSLAFRFAVRSAAAAGVTESGRTSSGKHREILTTTQGRPAAAAATHRRSPSNFDRPYLFRGASAGSAGPAAGSGGWAVSSSHTIRPAASALLTRSVIVSDVVLVWTTGMLPPAAAASRTFWVPATLVAKNSDSW
mmetsp:Transcript_81748/g.243786  ORF Transcript_81748/g.243786 Transcript_81748/m.243786 type:complete len:212 (+) Transcript_81748:336-971(+)